ncbi:hypothetical protein BDZ91DRAFT_720438 [Kalaharituber pfeilii]|nr:hypothetical protein BDZ91DRAFT_720438 [Kalaharituber pfeilii]
MHHLIIDMIVLNIWAISSIKIQFCLYVSKALTGMQQKYVLFPRILGKGNCVRKLADALLCMQCDLTVDDALDPFALAPSSSVENLIILTKI